MLLRIGIVILAIVQIIAAHENPEVPVVVVSQHQLRQDVRKEVTSVVQQATANITDAIGEVTRKVDWAVSDVIEPLRDEIAQEVNSALKNVITNVTDAVEQFLKPLLDKLASQNLPGKSPTNPAASCKEVKANDRSAASGYYWVQNSDIPLVQVYCKMMVLGEHPDSPASSCKEIDPSSPSGFYWIKAGNESSIRVYCDMTRTCGGITGGWMQVANIDMTDSSHTCPQGLKTLTSQKRLCGINIIREGCSPVTFATNGAEYTHICGKIIGYQKGDTCAFILYNQHMNRTIDDTYVTGVSLTHGRSPRKHIWTLAAAVDESTRYRSHNCPCTNSGTQSIPPWVGQDYFCDTAVEDWARQRSNNLYPDDPLWDGRGCGATSTCCSFNNPPWFSKQLPSPTTDDIEMRLCVRYSSRSLDVPVEMVELYVQ